MEAPLDHLLNFLSDHRDGITALGIIAITFIAYPIVRAALARVAKIKTWTPLQPLVSQASSLVFVIGLMLFVEVAPLHRTLSLILNHAAYVIAVVIGLSLLRKALLIGIEWSSLRSTQSSTLQIGFIPLLRNIITLFVFLSGSIMVLKRFNYDVMSLVTALGVSSLAVGLAAKDTLSNMISGFMLIIDRNLKPGDKVNLGGSVGEVDEIGLRSTRIKTGDGNLLIVPNSELVNTKILNLSWPQPDVTCSSVIRVPIETPFDEVREHCRQAILEVSKARQDRNHWINLSSLAAGHQEIAMGFWVASLDDQGPAISELNQRLLKRLSDARISLVGEPLKVIAAR